MINNGTKIWAYFFLTLMVLLLDCIVSQVPWRDNKFALDYKKTITIYNREINLLLLLKRLWHFAHLTTFFCSKF